MQGWVLSSQAAPTRAGATQVLPGLHTSPLWHSSLLPDAQVAPAPALSAQTPQSALARLQNPPAHWLLSPQVAPLAKACAVQALVKRSAQAATSP